MESFWEKGWDVGVTAEDTVEFSEAANNMIQKFDINPFRPDREEINPNFYFRNSLWCLKRFYKGLKGLHKTFEGTARKCEVKHLR